jgi:hypothetical protein
MRTFVCVTHDSRASSLCPASELMGLELARHNTLVRRDPLTGDLRWSVGLHAPPVAAFLPSGADVALQPPAQSPLPLPASEPTLALPEGASSFSSAVVVLAPPPCMPPFCRCPLCVHRKKVKGSMV